MDIFAKALGAKLHIMMVKNLAETQKEKLTPTRQRTNSMSNSKMNNSPKSANFRKRTFTSKVMRPMQTMCSTDFDFNNPVPGKAYTLPKKIPSTLEAAEAFHEDYLRKVKANRDREFGPNT